jgi:hypothetical protein
MPDPTSWAVRALQDHVAYAFMEWTNVRQEAGIKSYFKVITEQTEPQTNDTKDSAQRYTKQSHTLLSLSFN